MSNDDDAEFADAVVDLYSRIRRGIPEERASKIPEDVGAVAFPLALIREALDLLSEKLMENPAPGKVKGSAIIPALHLLDSLLTGAAHPFWRYSDAIRQSIPHRPPPSDVESMRRAMAVGLLRALTQGASLSERRAAATIETECLKFGMRIRAGQIREWNTQFLTERKDDPEPDRCAQRFRGNGKGDANQIAAFGARTLDEFFGKLKR